MTSRTLMAVVNTTCTLGGGALLTAKWNAPLLLCIPAFIAISSLIAILGMLFTMALVEGVRVVTNGIVREDRIITKTRERARGQLSVAKVEGCLSEPNGEKI